MKKRQFKLPVILLIALSLSLAALITMAIGFHKRPGQVTRAKAASPENGQPIVYDPVLLKRFITTIHSLDFNKPKCTYKGVIDMTDGNDTSNNARGLKFSFCRSGDDYYYQLGSNEIIHRDSLNLYIQHDQRKIVLSKRAIVIKPPTNDLALVEKDIRSESYLLKSTFNGTNQTLSLLNEHHITCKELSVTLDTASGRLERIYTRLTDFGSPVNKNRDRVMRVDITLIKDEVNMQLYPAVKDILKKNGNKWELAAAYKDYELIRF
jgi:hypothetical protein